MGANWVDGGVYFWVPKSLDFSTLSLSLVSDSGHAGLPFGLVSGLPVDLNNGYQVLETFFPIVGSTFAGMVPGETEVLSLTGVPGLTADSFNDPTVDTLVFGGSGPLGATSGSPPAPTIGLFMYGLDIGFDVYAAIIPNDAPTPAPEPSTLSVFGFGVAGLLVRRKLRPS